MTGQPVTIPSPPAVSPGGWTALGAILARPGGRVIRGEARASLMAAWEEIAAAERLLDDRLFLGIIGGTGVGKSTLINAIAAAEISRASDRRPTTDRVVVYRHRGSPLPRDIPRGDLAEPEAVHDHKRMEKLVVFDFPDFDSVAADHAEILTRFLPRLDVLFVVVDDEKYADRCLFDLMAKIPQAAANIHFVFNKVDRVAEKYGETWRPIAARMLDDFAAKLSSHARLEAAEGRFAAISARMALARRRDGGGGGGKSGLRPEAGASEREAPEGDFPRVIAILEAFHAEKRRRAAKEANIDARKAALAARVREIGLSPARRERVIALRRGIGQRVLELEKVLASISSALLSPRERRALEAEALRKAQPYLADPVAVALRFLGPKRAGAPLSGATMGAAALDSIATRHFSPHRESLGAAEREFTPEVVDLAGPPEDAPPAVGGFTGLGADFYRLLDAKLEQAVKPCKRRAYVLLTFVVAGWFWLTLHPVISEVVKQLASREPVAWGESAGRAFALLVAGLGPTGLVWAALLFLAVFSVIVYLDGRRIRGAVRAAVAVLDASPRAQERTLREARLRSFTAALAAWEKERGELEKALGGPR